ncbi:hypothetical protein FHETE_8855 [Fusarium heterosporum]|uniref:NAD(P)-binding domain-containing protein n=1 Tax=Fusarium heterosporum TaxID=42747 RepID=A0A8H5WFI4_FUSHE|nr:hypothetical protein FHETE_8855 [Fusarium heterosporum]
MHFFLLGATGRTGKLVISELLSQNHTAIALVRNPASLTAQPGLAIVAGSPLSKDDIRRALETSLGQPPSAAIMTLNANRKSESPFAAPLSPPRFLADSCANACEVLKETGIHRFVVMSTAGVGDSWGNLPLLSKAFMGLTNVKYALEDHSLLDEEIRMTEVDWTLVRAVRLVFDNVEGKNMETLDSAGTGMTMSDRANVGSVAKFLVKAAVESLYIKEAVVVRDCRAA